MEYILEENMKLPSKECLVDQCTVKKANRMVKLRENTLQQQCVCTPVVILGIMSKPHIL